jgi:hypothetical protein
MAVKARTVVLLVLTTGFIATAGFGVFPSNPLSDGVRGFISENYPAIILQPVNSVLQEMAVATFQGQNETAPEVANEPEQTGPAAGVVGLAGAAGVASTSIFTNTPTASVTFTVTPTVTMTPTASITPTVSMTPAAQTCFTLTKPANGTVLPTQGNVLFSWTAMPRAAKYEITFTAPDKTWSKYTLTGTTTYTFPIGTLISGGTYTWTVSAYDAAGKLLCTALEFKFKKDVSSTPTPTGATTDTPIGTGTVFPTTPPYSGAGNTVFSGASGPSGTVDCSGGVSFSIFVTDPDGFTGVFAEYYWTGGDGPTTFSLDYIDADNWSTFTGPLSSGDYGYDFYSIDAFGNYESSPGGSFTCQ